MQLVLQYVFVSTLSKTIKTRIHRQSDLRVCQWIIYGAFIGGGLAIIKNLSLEGEPFQAFLMERVPIVSDL